MIYPVVPLALPESAKIIKNPQIKEMDPINKTSLGHCERSFSEYTLRI